MTSANTNLRTSYLTGSNIWIIINSSSSRHMVGLESCEEYLEDTISTENQFSRLLLKVMPRLLFGNSSRTRHMLLLFVHLLH